MPDLDHLRAVLRAAAHHVALGHTGLWCTCTDPVCRDAQNMVPPLSGAALARLEPLNDARSVES